MQGHALIYSFYSSNQMLLYGEEMRTIYISAPAPAVPIFSSDDELIQAGKAA